MDGAGCWAADLLVVNAMCHRSPPMHAPPQMNAEKLQKMAGAVRVGGKGSVRR